MRLDTLQLRTQDGTCPTHVFKPSTGDDLPGVLMFMDGLAIRPSLFEIADRLAEHGYFVVLPDLYYRSGATAADMQGLFSDPDRRAHWQKNVMPTVSIANIARDLPAFFSVFDSEPLVRRGPLGANGYCLGGRLAVAMSGLFPDRFAAVGSYHPGGLVTDAPDSPHLLAPRIKARLYIGRAKDDPGFTDAQLDTLEAALTNAHVDHVIETYDALHGWVPTDTPVYDPKAADEHWRTLFNLLDGTFGVAAVV